MSNAAFNNNLFSAGENGSVASKPLHPSAERLYDVAAQLDPPVVGPSALARWLGVSPQTMTNWESRGVSKEGAIKVQGLTGYTVSWILHGVGEPKAEAPAPVVAARYRQLLIDLEALGPTQRNEFMLKIHEAAEHVREALQYHGAKPKVGAAASRRGGGRSVATLTYGDGNRRQAALPLATVDDPFTAAPGERESALYKRIQRAPKEPKGSAADPRTPSKRRNPRR